MLREIELSGKDLDWTVEFIWLKFYYVVDMDSYLRSIRLFMNFPMW